ncbi:hypothetical protein BX666DRAFT_1902384 [Dichotomocladium elegans]|nr:hypothetical protein BX666DRAFT_1902384 [Dichotomocladium elegans]
MPLTLISSTPCIKARFILCFRFLSLSLSLSLYIETYIYMCVCNIKKLLVPTFLYDLNSLNRKVRNWSQRDGVKAAQLSAK